MFLCWQKNQIYNLLESRNPPQNRELTGRFFEKQTADALMESIAVFKTQKFDLEYIRNEALKFSEERFKNEFRAFINHKLKEHDK